MLVGGTETYATGNPHSFAVVLIFRRYFLRMMITRSHESVGSTFDNGGCVNSTSHSCDDNVLQRCVGCEMQIVGPIAVAFLAVQSHAIFTRFRGSALATCWRIGASLRIASGRFQERPMKIIPGAASLVRQWRS